MNNFYASVECMLNPELKNKPVAVCGSVEERHGIVLAKNYAAKAFGVSTGEAIWQAKQKCQNLVIVEPHYEQYMKFSKLARGIYGRYTDQIEPYGMDECWLDVTGSGCMGTGFEIADEIRRTVKFELGLTISAGVSFNKIFAKLGSDMKKPDAITCIEADSFQEKIWCLPASDLLGVGRATEKVLSGYGIHTIGELAATSDDFLKCRLGKNGLAIKKYANGLDDSPVMRSDYVSPVKSIGHGITTMQDLENNAEVWCVMLELVQEDGAEPVYRITLPELQEKVQDDSLNLQKFTASVTLQTLAHSDDNGKTVAAASVKVPVNETNTADATEDAQSMDSAESVEPAETAESTAAESAPASVPPVLMRARAALPMATPETAAAPDETDAAETAPPERTETSDAS